MSETYRHAGKPLGAYSALLVMTIAGFFAYMQWVDPLISPPIEIARNQPISENEYEKIGEETEHHRWFADTDWERNPCSVLRTATGKILFQDYQLETKESWLVFPFTMIIYPSNVDTTAANPQPTILQCEGGARLFFDKPVSSLDSSKISLQTAQLEGKVEIFSTSKNSDGIEEMRIQTSNIRISDQQIRSLDDVAFRFGTHTGFGRNMTIELTQFSRAQPNRCGFFKDRRFFKNPPRRVASINPCSRPSSQRS